MLDTINPILAKDAKISLRKTRAAVLQLLFIASCFLLTVVLWPQKGLYSVAAQSARQLFTVLGMGQLTLVALFAPAFTSVSVTMEKERGTMHLLYGTLMSPFTIAWGKIAGGLAFLVLVILSSIPITSACLALGGVDAADVGRMYLVLCLTALSFGMIGLMISTLCRHTYIAVISTYVVILVLSGVLVVPSMMFIRETVGGSMPLHVSRSLSPFVAMLSVVQPQFFRYTGEVKALRPAWQVFTALSAVSIVGCGAVVFWRLRRAPAPKPRWQKEPVSEKFLRRLSRWPFYLVNPHAQRGMIGLLFNPVLVKEFRTKTFGRLINLVRGIYVCFLVSMGLMILCALSSFLVSIGIIAVFLVCFQMAIVLFLVPILSAPLVSAEIENGQFELLRFTRLRAWTIVSGKFQAVLIPVLILLGATVPPYFVIAYLDANLIGGMIRAVVTVVLSVVFVCAAGLCTSAFSRRTARAISATYTLVVVLCVISMLGLLARGILEERVLVWLFRVNPVAVALGQLELGVLKDYDLWRWNAQFLAIGALVMLVTAALRVGCLLRPR
jgi:ABC-type transport system involved in multi-copper enzyme maturation permease subunit